MTALPAVVLNVGPRGKRPPCIQQTFKTSALHEITVKINTTVNLLCTKPHNQEEEEEEEEEEWVSVHS
jgi:hypothetical protein